MLATKQRKNERFTSRHKIETLRRDGETLIAQSEHILEEMDKLGRLLFLTSSLFHSFALFRNDLQGDTRKIHG